MKIAVLGASGIGKNHARWFMSHGAQFVAFLGSSPASVERTQTMLRNLLGFEGEGYWDLELLLKQARPDAVCVASPNACHYEETLACVAHGIPVLCEKPLTHDPALSDDANITRAHEMVDRAAAANVVLGTQMQYAFLIPPMCRMLQVAPEEVDSFSMVMQTKNLIPGREGKDLWVDLAPHPLSVLQTIAPGSELVACRQFTSEGLHSEAVFTVRRPNGSQVEAKVSIGCVPGQEPLRRVELNGKSLEYSGFRDSDGVFRARVATEKENAVIPDFVDSLVGNFLAACRDEGALQVTGATGAQNLEWLLKLAA